MGGDFGGSGREAEGIGLGEAAEEDGGGFCVAAKRCRRPRRFGVS